MKVMLLYEYPALPAGLSTQGQMLHRGLEAMGIEVRAAHWESTHEKEWNFRWFAPDIVAGIGYWGYAPHLVRHPRLHGLMPVPWLVADGYIANYQDELNSLPLLLVTSRWVEEVYAADGIDPRIIRVLPVGCDTDLFIPRDARDLRVRAVRDALGIAPDELMLLTIGGDAASKGAREMIRALALVDREVPRWRYVCKVWPQQRTVAQNRADQQLAESLGIADRVIFVTGRASRDYIPYLIGACDLYAGPSRLEGFGMPHIEAGASGKPVIAIDAMAFRDTLVHGETAYLARVARENRITEATVGEEAGYPAGHRLVFPYARIADYRASVEDLADGLRRLMNDAGLRRAMGEAGRARVAARFDYRVVARQFVNYIAPLLPTWRAPLSQQNVALP